MWYLLKKKQKNPINGKTVRQLGRMGLIPLDDAAPSYLWDIYSNSGESIVTTVYFLEKDTRPMTEEEYARFMENPKSYSQAYADKYTEILRRQKNAK